MQRPVIEAPPSWYGAAHARNLTSVALRMTYQLRPHGAHHMGTSGPLLMVTASEGMLAGAFVRATAQRPIHVVASEAMSQAVPEAILVRAGDIPLSGPAAVISQRKALAALDDERAVLLAGGAVSPGYLLASTGAPVMAVVLLGADGKVPTDPPRPRSRIDVFYFPPVTVQVPGDPLKASTRTALDERVRQLVADARHEAVMRAGLRP
jgi:1-acyl-sn-glycerol-3-phosphate acyltransferase